MAIDLERVARDLAIRDVYGDGPDELEQRERIWAQWSDGPKYFNDDPSDGVFRQGRDHYRTLARVAALDVIEQLLAQEHRTPFRRQGTVIEASDGTKWLDATQIVREALTAAKSTLESRP